MRLVCGVAVVLMCLSLLAAVWSFAGEVEPGASPGATMKSLQQVHDKIEEIDAKMPGLARVARTGATRAYYFDDDGWVQAGVPWPDPRFTDNGDGTVTDNLTRLVWLKNCECPDTAGGVDMSVDTNWYGAMNWAAALADPACGLSDGSVAGDWRLPNIVELLSLVDYGRHNPAFPEGHPFVNFDFNRFPYIKSSTTSWIVADAWNVDFRTGRMEICSIARWDDNVYFIVRDAKEGEQGGAP